MIPSLRSIVFFTLCFSTSFLVQAQGLFQLNGQATVVAGDECYRLTPETNTRYGSMWFRKKADLTKAFDLSARIYLGTKDSGADGMTFAFQNECTSSGSIGGSLGMGGVSPSLLVEFDTFRNTDFGDPVEDHIGIQKNGSPSHTGTSALAGPVSALANNGNIENGQYWDIRVWWTPSDSTLRVFFNGEERLSYKGDIVGDVFSDNPYVYWGFTASTGGLNNIHRVCITSFPDNVVELSDVAICQGESFQAALPGGVSYVWSPNYMISSTSIYNPVLFPDVTTEYIVSITDQCNNVQKDTITVVVNPLPTVGLGSFDPVCNGSASFNLSGGSPAGGTYSGTGVNAGQFNAGLAGVGTHTVSYSYTDNNQCTAAANSSIEVLAVTDASLQAFDPVCSNAPSFVLTGGSPSGGTYSGAGVSGGAFNPTTAGSGTHTITYSYTAPNGCVSTANQGQTVHAKPSAIINTPQGTVICSGSSVALNAGASVNTEFQWLRNGNPVTTLSASHTTYAAADPGNYTLRAVNNQGCEEVSTAVVITTGTTPAANLNATDTEFCPGESITFSTTLQGGETLAWYRNGNVINGVSALTYETSVTGTYTIRVTASDGCVATSTGISITQLNGPTATLSSNVPAFCPEITTVILTASSVTDATYLWYENSVLIDGAETSQFDATTAGTYTVRLTLPNGCTQLSSPVVLSNASSPLASISAADNEFCQGSSMQITAVSVSGATYTWYRDAQQVAGPAAANSYNATAAGEYQVTVKSNLGCSTSSNTLTMTVNALPTATISMPSTQLCQGNDQHITANLIEGASYEWFRNNVSLGAAEVDDNILNVSLAGTYKVRINDGCTAMSNELTLQVISLPSNAGTISGSNDFCPGADAVAFSVPSAANATDYVWEVTASNKASIATGQGTRNITVNFLNQTVTLKVTPRNSCGVGNSSSKQVSLSTDVFCTLGKTVFGAYPTNTCQGSTVTFHNYTTDNLFGTSPRWNFGAGASPATANGNGPHNVTYSTSGVKSVTLEYVDDFSGFVIRSETKTNYINISGSVSTSAISGNTDLNQCSDVQETYSVVSTAGSSYQWQVSSGATIVSGQGTHSIAVAFNGSGSTVSVTETNASGCVGAVVSLTVNCSGVTSIGKEQLAQHSFEAYPNPTNGILHLKAFFHQAAKGDYTLCVYDMNGKLVHHQQDHVSDEYTLEKTLDLTGYARGLYTVIVYTAQEKVYRKVILE